MTRAAGRRGTRSPRRLRQHQRRVLNPTAQYTRVCPAGVELFTSAEKVGKEYTEVAVLNSSGNTGSTNEQQMFESQRKKAADLGANGIVLNGVKEPNAGTKIFGALFGTGAERKGTATAIYIPGDSVRVREACPVKEKEKDRES